MAMKDEAINPKPYLAGLAEQDKIKTALMYLVLKHGEQDGHWSGDADRLADALWDKQAGLDGADLELDLHALAPVIHWCDLRVDVVEGRLHIRVLNTVV